MRRPATTKKVKLEVFGAIPLWHGGCFVVATLLQPDDWQGFFVGFSRFAYQPLLLPAASRARQTGPAKTEPFLLATPDALSHQSHLSNCYMRPTLWPTCTRQIAAIALFLACLCCLSTRSLAVVKLAQPKPRKPGAL